MKTKTHGNTAQFHTLNHPEINLLIGVWVIFAGLFLKNIIT